MWTLRKIFASCLDPTVLLFIVMLVAFVLLLCHQRTFGLVLMAIGLIAMLVMGLPQLSSRLIGSLEQRYPVVLHPEQSVHWVVVLGAGMVYDKHLPVNMQLSAASMLRLIEAVRVYKELPQAKLVISGGRTIDEQFEANFRKQAAEILGVPTVDIVVMPPALNTHQEAKFTKKIVGEQRFYLVTSATHMPRSMALFKGQGLQPLAAPANFIVRHGKTRLFRHVLPSSSGFVKMAIYFYEKIGYAWAWLRGYLH